MQILLSELSWIWTTRRSNQSFIFSTLTCISGHLLLCKHKLALQYCAPYWLGVITSTKCPLTAGVRNYVTPSVWERMCVRVAAVPTAMLWLKRSRPLHGKVCSHFVLIHDVKLCQSYNYSFKYSSSLICVCVCVCLCSQLELAHSGKFNSQIHVEYTWEMPQEFLYDSEDDLDEKVCEHQAVFIIHLYSSLIQHYGDNTQSV